jgi:starch synthase
MKILLVSAECAPFAKVGGLADVAGALPIALRALGHDVRVLLPRYRMIETDSRWNLAEAVPSFEVELNPNWVKTASLATTTHRGVPFYFLGTDDWFVHSVDSDHLYQPGGDPHLFLCAGTLAACEALDWIPDVLHLNDWHTGLLPVLLREKASPRWHDTKTLFTIHNLAYQGEFGAEILDQLDLRPSLFSSEGVEAWGRLNFLKAGAMFADQVNTVSPTYAREILTPQYGCTLDGVMRHLSHEKRLSGILNGIDTETFNPATDPALPANFSVNDLGGKAKCGQALRSELGLNSAPIASVVSRLSEQKGLDLILAAAPALLDLPLQLVVLGVGDPILASGWRDLQRQFPGRVAFVERFDVALAQRIYAGSDLFLMPSRFEPCGLGQLIAMRYGTIPVVRRTGGLADTVIEGETGFTFDDVSLVPLIAAVARAIQAYREPESWGAFLHRAMTQDHSWASAAIEYESLYLALSLSSTDANLV